MDMAADISALQVASGSNLANYQEIVRDEKSANCRARWPLLAQTARVSPVCFGWLWLWLWLRLWLLLGSDEEEDEDDASPTICSTSSTEVTCSRVITGRSTATEGDTEDGEAMAAMASIG